jgi:predicted kinase
MTDNLLIVTVGLPRAGKSTWARAFSRQHGIPVVSPDAIRLALHGQTYASEAEPFVAAIAKTMVRSLFLAGHSVVIVDATHMTRKRRDAWKSPKWTTRFKVFATPKDECIRRAHRKNQAGLVPTIERMARGVRAAGQGRAQARVSESTPCPTPPPP